MTEKSVLLRPQALPRARAPTCPSPCYATGHCTTRLLQTWTRTRSAIASLAAVGNSLKLCKIFPMWKLNSEHSIPKQKK